MNRIAAPKRVVYLWGAGATHSEAHRLGAKVSLLMRDTEQFEIGVASRILKRLGERIAASYGSVDGIDIEKLISLLSASANATHTNLAEKMRQNYFTELKSSLAEAGVLDQPHLAIALLRMHNDYRFRENVETLSGFITTNHDGLLQVASQAVYERVNIGFEFESKDFVCDAFGAIPPILQLHGSFSWKFGTPISVGRLRLNSAYEDRVWIPPTILKESKNYPFNKLAGQAFELLARRCDVLRVVGASLTQNDWNILSLIFHAQRHQELVNRAPFAIELIMPHPVGESVKRDCAYLKGMRSIGFLTEGSFRDYIKTEYGFDSDLTNPFAYWLSEKTQFHARRGELDARAPATSEGTRLEAAN